MNISPEQVHELPPVIRHDFLPAFVDALQPVFIVGAAVTLVAFVLACALKEVPLRGTTHAPLPIRSPTRGSRRSTRSRSADADPRVPRPDRSAPSGSR